MGRWIGRCGTTDDLPVYFLFTNPDLMAGLRTTPWMPMSSAKVAETYPPHHIRWEEERGPSGPVIGSKTRKIISFGGPDPVKGGGAWYPRRPPLVGTAPIPCRRWREQSEREREREREKRGPQRTWLSLSLPQSDTARPPAVSVQPVRPGWPPFPYSDVADSFLLSRTLLVPPAPYDPCRAGLRHGVAARSMSGGDVRARSGRFLSVGSVVGWQSRIRGERAPPRAPRAVDAISALTLERGPLCLTTSARCPDEALHGCREPDA
ncbi:hypothetical protein CGRA01v4_06884 [Colletotrichum graminicola]|nr:hypothetical protein CGRA01v4_06884 [Colletotrichum graminicola]